MMLLRRLELASLEAPLNTGILSGNPAPPSNEWWEYFAILDTAANQSIVDHDAVLLNTIHRTSDGKDHFDVVLNTVHSGSTGVDHGFIDQDVTTSGCPTFTCLTVNGDTLITGDLAVSKEGAFGNNTRATTNLSLQTSNTGIQEYQFRNNINGVVGAMGYTLSAEAFYITANGGFSNFLEWADDIIFLNNETIIDGALDVSGNLTTNVISATALATNGSGRVIASTEVPLNTTHRASSGVDHGFINQDVTTGASPNFVNLDLLGYVSIGQTDPSSLDSRANDLIVGDGTSDRGATIFSGASSSGNLFFADGSGGSLEQQGRLSYDHSTDKLSLWAFDTQLIEVSTSLIDLKTAVNISGLLDVANNIKVFGYVSIGQVDPSSLDARANDLIVGDGISDRGLTIFSGTTGTGNVFFADGSGGSDEQRGQIAYDHVTNTLSIWANDTQMIDITSSLIDLKSAVTVSGNLTTNVNSAAALATNGSGVVIASTAVPLNTTHRTSNGQNHSDVVLNNTHRTSNGTNHSDVVLNNTHRTSSTGDSHSYINQSVTTSATPSFDGLTSENNLIINNGAVGSGTNKLGNLQFKPFLTGANVSALVTTGLSGVNTINVGGGFGSYQSVDVINLVTTTSSGSADSGDVRIEINTSTIEANLDLVINEELNLPFNNSNGLATDSTGDVISAPINTFEGVASSAEQFLTTSFADVAGSTITLTVPTGFTTATYKIDFLARPKVYNPSAFCVFNLRNITAGSDISNSEVIGLFSPGIAASDIQLSVYGSSFITISASTIIRLRGKANLGSSAASIQSDSNGRSKIMAYRI